MSEDHLNNEVSVSARITESGLEAKSKSRLFSAVDRLLGSLFDVPSAALEASSARKRAESDAEVDLIRAVGEQAARIASSDPDIVRRSIDQYARSILRKQKNKDAVVAQAIEQIKISPASSMENEGEDALSEDFMDRFEAYAEHASTEDLQERWGRVLASEVLMPGTFSRKVLRVVDEISPDVARDFESICSNLIDGCIPKMLSGEINYRVQTDLTTSDLLVDPGLGQHRILPKVALELEGVPGEEIWFFAGKEVGFGISVSAKISGGSIDSKFALTLKGEELRLPVYLLTDAGRAIASILPIDEKVVLNNLIQEVFKQIPEATIHMLSKDASSQRWVLGDKVLENGAAGEI